jgi:hypothetical protein
MISLFRGLYEKLITEGLERLLGNPPRSRQSRRSRADVAVADPFVASSRARGRVAAETFY